MHNLILMMKLPINLWTATAWIVNITYSATKEHVTTYLETKHLYWKYEGDFIEGKFFFGKCLFETLFASGL